MSNLFKKKKKKKTKRISTSLSNTPSIDTTGHALLDDALGAFKLMHTHMRLTKSAQLIFHEHCNLLYGPDGVSTGDVSGQDALDRCLKFQNTLSRGISTRIPLHLYERSNVTTATMSGSSPSAVATNNLCFGRVLVGASAMSLRHEHLGTAAIYQSFRRFFMSNLGIEVPRLEEEASASGLESRRLSPSLANAHPRRQHRRHPRTKQHVSFFVKTRGFSGIDVDPASIRALADRVRAETQADVDVFDPSTLTIEEQIRRLIPTTVLVTPMGGIDSTSVFVSPATSVIYVGQRKGLMFCGHVYSHAGPHVLFLNATGELTWESIRSHMYKSFLFAEKELGLENSFVRA